ncbi:hypothetical protein [Rhodoferax ferrireducens]|uniref:hypothetical protein n=1 Tax=Rhodoferax ferrireducens TaxID=192843 RepID=UPI000E0CF505|nr:hypothetical protein [Rhodoferax ferrireducens]
MDDLTKILLTSSFTAIGAIAVFVASQLLGKLVIEPVQDLKKLLGEIRHALVFHAQAVFTPVGDCAGEDKAAEAFRKSTCDLRSKLGSVPFYDRWATVSQGFLPMRKDAFEASKELIGLSNSVHQQNRSEINAKRVTKIERLLGFEMMEE